MADKPITGGCYCGKIRFKATARPIHQANCHCQNCRRAAGAQAVAWITVKTSEFSLEKGNPKRYQTETGAYRTFCDSCGTSLTYENPERPGEIDITTGSLDQPEDFVPNKDVFPEEKLPWVSLVGPATEILCWSDIPVADLQRATQFYSALLGKEVSILSAGDANYGLLPHEQGAAACLCVNSDSAGLANRPSESGPLIYISVEGRLDEAIQAARANGAKVLEKKNQIGEHGFRAVIVDSEGNRIALHSTK